MPLVAGAVAVATAGERDERTGLTVATALSLSIDPPAMIVCVNRNASALPVIARRGHFCVNPLATGQEAIAARFSDVGGVKGPARYDGAAWRPLETGALALEGALASIDCAVEERIERHSHGIVVGAVRRAVTRPGDPLVYAQGRYCALAQATREAAASAHAVSSRWN